MSEQPVSSYPLSWPYGWKRTTAGSRKRAKFHRTERQYSSQPGGGSWLRKADTTVSDSVARILSELKMMGCPSWNVVVSTNIKTKRDGLPYSNMAEPIDPGVAVYWRGPKDARQVMAIDQYDRVADNLAAIAATLGAMRAIERHGGAAILDRAFTGFAALPSPEKAGAAPWRQVLKVEGEVTLEQAKEAYRRRAKETHPDHGGDADAFNLVQVAWTMAQQELRP